VSLTNSVRWYGGERRIEFSGAFGGNNVKSFFGVEVIESVVGYWW
jgi:hypothetical protein